MPTTQTIILFAGIALLFAASPGPNFVFVLSRSMGYGRQEGLMSTLGIGTGGLFHTAAAVLGISALLTASTLAFNLVKFAGAAYLIYLGLRTLVQRHETEFQSQVEPGQGHPYREGLITMLLNPKAALYYFSFLPQFVDPTLGDPSLQLVIFGLLQVLAALVVYTIITLFAGFLGDRLRRHSRIRQGQRWITGVTYLALGAGVAVSGRR